jgi:peptide deformylase
MGDLYQCDHRTLHHLNGQFHVGKQFAGLVHRHNRITIKAKDIEGNDIQLRLKGYPAIVFQHEIRCLWL